MPTETEIAWAAGYFEAQGHVSMYKGYSPHPQLKIASKYRESLERFMEGVGARPLIHGSDDRWYFSMYRYEEVEKVFEILKPWLSNRRIRQFEQALVPRPARIVKPRPARPRREIPLTCDDTKLSARGYQRHRARGEPSCQSCIDEATAYQRSWRDRKKENTDD